MPAPSKPRAHRHAHVAQTGRRAPEVLSAHPHAHGREALLKALSEAKEALSATALARAASVPVRTASSALRKWCDEGRVVQLSSDGKWGGSTWLLCPDAPPAGPEAESGRERMWRTMKLLRAFTPQDLAVHASLPGAEVAEAEAKYYCRMLAQAGYLVVAAPAKPARGGHQASYRLVKSTGPKAPQVTRLKAVWDPNEQRLAWHEQPAEAAP